MNRLSLITVLALMVGSIRADGLAKQPNATVWCQTIYNQLLATMGDPPDAPRLMVVPTTSRSATQTLTYVPAEQPEQRGQINVATRVLVVCRGFGPEADAALASLLGHELAHFQYRHGSKQGFFAPVVAAGTSARMAGSSVNLEAVADRAGVFLAYLAGYNAFAVAPRVYTRLYDAFNLPARLDGYPTRADRLRMVADTAARVRELAQLWEVGEVQYWLGDYAGADQTLTALASRYPSAMVLNNLGAVNLNAALARLEPARYNPKTRYHFPVEFDADNRLLTSRRRDEGQPALPLLTQALTLFQTAQANAPTYVPARINAAIALYLLDRPADARQQLAGLTLPNATLMRAILDAGTDPTQARQRFRQARQQGAFRAALNEQLFKATQQSTVERFWARLLSKQNPLVTDNRPLPAVPTLLPPADQPTTWLPHNIQYVRTDSLTMYLLPLTLDGKQQTHTVWRSDRVGLPRLPLGSPATYLASYRPPNGTLAGSRGTVVYRYTLGDDQLLLEYRHGRFVGWSWVKA